MSLAWPVSGLRSRPGSSRIGQKGPVWIAPTDGESSSEWAPTFIALGNGLRTYEVEKEQVHKIPPQATPQEPPQGDRGFVVSPGRYGPNVP
jgi:hypothetical protein